MRLVFLGTTAGVPTIERGHIAIAICHKGRITLFDCGENTQRQMIKAGLSIMAIENIFITHFHGDHFLGVPGLFQSLSLLDREKPLKIYGPPELETVIGAFLEMAELGIFNLTFDVELQEISPGSHIKLDDFSIQSELTEHSITNLAYSLEEPERPGKFYPEKAKKLGVKPGPAFGRLQRGESLKLKDGTVVQPKDVMGPPRPGRKIVYSGDTRQCDTIIKLAQHSDVLIHEATFADDLADRAQQVGHTTFSQAATVAREAKAKKLILTHISPRYDAETLDKLIRKAKRIFPQTYLANDFDEHDVSLPDS